MSTGIASKVDACPPSVARLSGVQKIVTITKRSAANDVQNGKNRSIRRFAAGKANEYERVNVQ